MRKSSFLDEVMETSFGNFISNNFEEEICECQSEGDYEQLIEDLNFFGSKLGIRVESHVCRVDEALHEFHSDDDFQEERFGRGYDNLNRRGPNDDEIRAMFRKLPFE